MIKSGSFALKYSPFMAGIYLHIPFCKQACTYCDFHFSTQHRQKDEMLEALRKEIQWEKNFLHGLKIKTIYFGGGTPSLLLAEEIQGILDLIHEHYDLELEEVTLEANPDDLSPSYLSSLRQTGVNRLSIGVQSFQDRDLQFMNRAHKAAQGENAIKSAQDHGFHRLSVDLIYGSPYLSDGDWENNLRKLTDWQVPHFSAYALTVEPSTALAHLIQKKKVPAVDPEKMANQFGILSATAAQMGYEHYEISNLALPGQYALHNSRYWEQEPYLGLGPSAHSYRGKLRRWNVSNNPLYIKAMGNPQLPRYEIETLTKADQVNEYLMTSLRTIWGCDLMKVATQWETDFPPVILRSVKPAIEKGWVRQSGDILYLTDSGRLFADAIASDLFVKT